MIKIWQSFASNNSSSYRLIARFTDAAQTKAVAVELAGLLADFGAQPRTTGFQAFARLYGSDWRDESRARPEDGPFVVADDTTLIVHHYDCLGFGPGVPAYLLEKGAEVEAQSTRNIHVSVLFRRSLEPRLEGEVDAIVAQVSPVKAFAAPWVREPTSGKLAVYRDAGTVGLFFPIDARDLEHLRAWFATHSLDAVVCIEAYADQELFVALASARCTACDARLEYLDPRLHDIETPQLVCKACGGLYDLAAFA